MIKWERVLRTGLQALIGGTVTFLAGLSLDMGTDALMLALLQLGVTTLSAVLMNIQKQIDEGGNYNGESC